MPSPKWAMRILVAVLLAGLFAGLTVMSRSSSHDAFPMYSSRRTGPMGASILYEVLSRSAPTDRNYLPQNQFRPKQATVFYLGISPVTLAHASGATLSDYEEIAKAGNRVVLGITSGQVSFGAVVITEDGNPDSQSKDLYNKRWDIRVVVSRNPSDKSITGFDVQPGANWSRVSEAGVWSRSFGKGSVLLVTNANRLTNEPLAREQEAQELVPLLAGGSHVIVFDESHLGIAESGSIAGLLRRYRLIGLVAGLLVFAALFFWRNAVRFPPAPATEREAETVVVGSGSQDMLAGLLETHIGSDQLIDICVAEWNRVRRNRQITSGAWKGQNQVAAYRTIAAELHQKGSKP